MTDNEIVKAYESALKIIATLEQNNSRLRETIARLLKENLGLKYDLQVASEESQCVETNAINEFATRLKEKAYVDTFGYRIVHVTSIDHLVKEMVEGDERE